MRRSLWVVNFAITLVLAVVIATCRIPDHDGHPGGIAIAVANGFIGLISFAKRRKAA